MIDKATLWAYMKEFIYAGIKGIIMKYGAYEPNNRQTWGNISARVHEFTEQLVPMKYLHETEVICDETINTEDAVKNNEFHLKFRWKVNEDDDWTDVDFDVMDGGIVTTEAKVGLF